MKVHSDQKEEDVQKLSNTIKGAGPDTAIVYTAMKLIDQPELRKRKTEIKSKPEPKLKNKRK